MRRTYTHIRTNTLMYYYDHDGIKYNYQSSLDSLFHPQHRDGHRYTLVVKFLTATIHEMPSKFAHG